MYTLYMVVSFDLLSDMRLDLYLFVLLHTHTHPPYPHHIVGTIDIMYICAGIGIQEVWRNNIQPGTKLHCQKHVYLQYV